MNIRSKEVCVASVLPIKSLKLLVPLVAKHALLVLNQTLLKLSVNHVQPVNFLMDPIVVNNVHPILTLLLLVLQAVHLVDLVNKPIWPRTVVSCVLPEASRLMEVLANHALQVQSHLIPVLLSVFYASVVLSQTFSLMIALSALLVNSLLTMANAEDVL